MTSVVRNGGTICAVRIPPFCVSSPRPSGTTVIENGKSLARLRGTMKSNLPVRGSVWTTARNPGPPENNEGRVTVIDAASAVVEQSSGVGQSRRSWPE
ncbi:MAG: hypothetical protein H6Q90_2689 [Deltaproteobacteria bacterium]|nr:hypothetical protein [Deltaproteobacteria bacterium]